MDWIPCFVYTLLLAVAVNGSPGREVACSAVMDAPRDYIIESVRCGEPKEVFITFQPQKSYEESYPRSVWVKRCVGYCDHLAIENDCLPKEKITRQIPVRVVSITTSKEYCALYEVEEHVSCQACTKTRRVNPHPAELLNISKSFQEEIPEDPPGADADI